MIEYYDMMFKRKSFRRFDDALHLSPEELIKLEMFICNVAKRLYKEMPMSYKIVPRHETSCKRGEYCLLIYGNHHNESLLNIGYVFAQLDFYLCTLDIGTCWYGMGKLKEQDMMDGLPFVIMIAIGKASKETFRRDYKAAKRKPNDELSRGEVEPSFLDYVKLTPSACNSQPWLFESVDYALSLYINPKDKMLIPKEKIVFYNTIDLGIILCSCEMWFEKHKINFYRTITNQKDWLVKHDKVATYGFKQK